MESVDAVLRQAAVDLDAIGARWAVIGGLAVAFRAEPRFTKDVDVAVAVANDDEAEGIVSRLQVRGYALASLVEQDYVNRLATARLVRPKAGTSSAFIDLLFANSGIEDEIVSRADRLEVLPDVFSESPCGPPPRPDRPRLSNLRCLRGRSRRSQNSGCDDPGTWLQPGARSIRGLGSNYQPSPEVSHSR
jgi:hypothetical protein